jgi:hypothetical protein
MRKTILLLALGLALSATPVLSQSQQLQQLELDISQLSLLKSMLQEMDQSYTILEQGYENIKGISQDNFNLHKGYLDSLLAVSPAVRGDPRIAATAAAQQEIMQEYGSASGRFKSSPNLTAAEVAYITAVYAGLLSGSQEDVQEMTMVITAGSLRMSDAERLSAIGRIYGDMADKLAFLRDFDKNVSLQAARRGRAAADVQTLKNLYGL